MQSRKFWVWVTILGNIVCHDNGRRLATSLLFFLSEDPATMQMQERGVSKSTTDSSQRLKNKHSSLCKLSESTAICFQFLRLRHVSDCHYNLDQIVILAVLISSVVILFYFWRVMLLF